jgi:hypothetical protein
VADQALALVLGSAAVHAALLTYDKYIGSVRSREGRDAVRLVSKGLRAAYDEHVTWARVCAHNDGFTAGLSPRQFAGRG